MVFLNLVLIEMHFKNNIIDNFNIRYSLNLSHGILSFNLKSYFR